MNSPIGWRKLEPDDICQYGDMIVVVGFDMNLGHEELKRYIRAEGEIPYLYLVNNHIGDTARTITGDDTVNVWRAVNIVATSEPIAQERRIDLDL